MLDAALVDALSHAVRPLPAVVRPASEFGESANAFEARLNAQIEAEESRFTQWSAQGVEARAQVSVSMQRALDLGFERHAVVAILDRIIGQIEDAARASAEVFEGRASTFRRQIKQARKLGLVEARVVERAADRTMAILQREQDERADMALFLRAWRSEFSSGGRGGPVFDDPDALDRYLREAASA